MANRIVGSVIIVDSSMGNLELLSASSGNYPGYLVNAFALISNDTSARILFTAASTADVIATVDYHEGLVHFAVPQRFNALKVPTITAGTGLIYLA